MLCCIKNQSIFFRYSIFFYVFAPWGYSFFYIVFHCVYFSSSPKKGLYIFFFIFLFIFRIFLCSVAFFFNQYLSISSCGALVRSSNSWSRSGEGISSSLFCFPSCFIYFFIFFHIIQLFSHRIWFVRGFRILLYARREFPTVLLFLCPALTTQRNNLSHSHSVDPS